MYESDKTAINCLLRAQDWRISFHAFTVVQNIVSQKVSVGSEPSTFIVVNFQVSNCKIIKESHIFMCITLFYAKIVKIRISRKVSCNKWLCLCTIHGC